MKRLNKIIIIILILSLAVISCEKKPKDKIISGVITLIINEVETSEGSEWKKAKLLEQVDISKVVRTKKKSKAEIFFTDKTRILLKEKTLFVPLLLTKRDKKFRFKQGYIFARVGKLAKNENFTVFTPSITVGVRGTEFAVISGENSHRVSVRQGNVKVNYNFDVIEKLLKHGNGSVRAVARQIKKGITLSEYKSVVISEDRVNVLKDLLNKVLNKSAPDENMLNKVTKLTRFEIKPANLKDFTWALEYLNEKPASKNGVPVILDGNNPETIISVNGKRVAAHKYSKVFAPGQYEFSFKLKQYQHSVKKKLEKGMENLKVKAPFPEEIAKPKPRKRQQTRQQGPYEANPDDRAAN